MEEKTQLVSTKRLQALLSCIDKEEKLDKEAAQIISQFTEKYISDILCRAALITKHKGNQAISGDDIKFVLETEFDYFIATGK
ncbi:transcription initiation factor TFIID subunit 12 [Nematocida displodere]|uniref:Transcription initiation factor TFIID subunit 12 n=1 Tax=Nematocida displodere TaxID=1805483 RepID=A0A177ECG7_9MICR|nr:transcription initiation factor TFIID subunit 12 [Nematocida displodere]